MELPEKFTERMRELLGSDYDSFIKSYQDQPVAGLRANTLKINTEPLLKLMGLDGERVAWCQQGIYTRTNDNNRPSKSVFYSAGLFYIQEPSAMVPGSLINVQPGDKVLDLCAAPGGKSTQIAAKLNGTGLLVANDVSASRCGALVKNIELSGVTNALIINEQPEKLSGRLGGFFDKIIIDAPCSGEGMFRKDRDAVKSWDMYKSEKCRALQRSILYHGAKMLKPGGELVYSTCTFEPEENECIIEDFLSNNSDFTVIPIDHRLYGLEQGRPEWAGGLDKLSGTARIWPHKQTGEGHFTAKLKKLTDDGGDTSGTTPATYCPKPDINAIALFNEFCNKYLNKRINGIFALHGISLYLVPQAAPDIRGIRTVRSGWYLGDIKTKRFEPSQAMAMGLKMDDAAYTIDYNRDDEKLFRYLRGESCDADEHTCDGWHLISVEGFPLGWAKVVNNRIKNKYLKGWMA